MGFVISLFSFVGSYYHVRYTSSPLVFSLFSDEYLVIFTSTFVSERLWMPAVSSPDTPLLMIRSLHNLFKTLDLPSGEGVLTYITAQINQLD